MAAIGWSGVIFVINTPGYREGISTFIANIAKVQAKAAVIHRVRQVRRAVAANLRTTSLLPI